MNIVPRANLYRFQGYGLVLGIILWLSVAKAINFSDILQAFETYQGGGINRSLEQSELALERERLRQLPLISLTTSTNWRNYEGFPELSVSPTVSYELFNARGALRLNQAELQNEIAALESSRRRSDRLYDLVSRVVAIAYYNQLAALVDELEGQLHLVVPEWLDVRSTASVIDELRPSLSELELYLAIQSILNEARTLDFDRRLLAHEISVVTNISPQRFLLFDINSLPNFEMLAKEEALWCEGDSSHLALITRYYEQEQLQQKIDESLDVRITLSGRATFTTESRHSAGVTLRAEFAFPDSWDIRGLGDVRAGSHGFEQSFTLSWPNTSRTMGRLSEEQELQRQRGFDDAIARFELEMDQVLHHQLQSRERVRIAELRLSKAELAFGQALSLEDFQRTLQGYLDLMNAKRDLLVEELSATLALLEVVRRCNWHFDLSQFY